MDSRGNDQFPSIRKITTGGSIAYIANAAAGSLKVQARTSEEMDRTLTIISSLKYIVGGLLHITPRGFFGPVGSVH